MINAVNIELVRLTEEQLERRALIAARLYQDDDIRLKGYAEQMHGEVQDEFSRRCEEARIEMEQRFLLITGQPYTGARIHYELTYD